MSKANGRVMPMTQVGGEVNILSSRPVEPSEEEKRRAGVAIVEAWMQDGTSDWGDVVDALRMLGIAPSPAPAVERDPVTRHGRATS